MLTFSSFELREPKQFLMLLYSVFLFIFLLADFTLDVLTEHCTHRAVFVCASTAENWIVVNTRHFCSTSCRYIVKLAPELKHASKFKAMLAR